LYCKKGQKTEGEMFGNENGSEAFEEFLNVLGDKIQLKGWEGFRGGLNTTMDITGTHSVFTQYSGYNIMFHVSTLMPFSQNETQQLERKRHIGNDIVTIIFQDEPGLRYSPLTISSQFLHVFFGIELMGKDQQGPKYRLNVCTNDKVPSYGPPLPSSPVFTKNDLKHFLLAKMINSEKAAYLAPAFQARRKRTLKGLLGQIHEKFYSEAKKNQKRLDAEAHTLMNRQTMLDTPDLSNNANINTDSEKKWKLIRDIPDLENVLSAEYIGERCIFGRKEDMVLWDGHALLPLKSEKNMSYSQISLSDEYGVLVALAAKPGKGSRIFFFDQQDIISGSASGTKLEETQNCTFFDLSIHPETNELNLYVLMKKSVLRFLWQATTSTFAKIKEIPVPETTTIIKSVKENLFVATKSEILVINLNDSSSHNIPLPDNPSKIEPNSILHLEKEVLISYGNVTIPVSEEGKKVKDIVFKWSSLPKAVARVGPFILGVSATQIEMRSAVNGSLLETKSIHSPQFLAASSLNPEILLSTGNFVARLCFDA